MALVFFYIKYFLFIIVEFLYSIEHLCCSFVIFVFIFCHICIVLLSYLICPFVIFVLFFCHICFVHSSYLCCPFVISMLSYCHICVVLSLYFCSAAALSRNRKDTMGANTDKLCGTYNIIIISIAVIITIHLTNNIA